MNMRYVQTTWRVMLALVFSFSFAGIYPREVHAGTVTVMTLLDSGEGSLRDAISKTNANIGADTIYFGVGGTITVLSDLPIISGDLTIDGGGLTVTISGNNLVRGLRIGLGVNVTLRNLTIDHAKTAGDTGGAVQNAGMLIVEDCTFSNNWALVGGAIYSTNNLQVSDSTFLDNTAGGGSGGAIQVYNSTATVSGSTFSGNHATQDGGGIDVYQQPGTATATVSNSTFEGNTAGNDGGGISVYYGTLTLVNSTLSGNGASSSAGGLNDYGGTVHLKNTLLANSTSGVDCDSALGLASALNNLFETSDLCGTSVSTADPNLSPLADNGGPTQTMALQAGSPAVDAGDAATCAAALVNNLDQRGVSRSYGTHCDIGSYELKKSSLTTRSSGTYDGHILESGELTNAGGTLDSTSTTFNLGDGAQDKQYRAVLSFNTASLPDDAVITKVTLKIRKQTRVGGNPFSLLGGLRVDVRKPYFGAGPGLVITDFQAAADRSAVGTFGTTPVAYWYSAVLNAQGRATVNKTGITQFRLRFFTDDNNDGSADYMKFYSGNYATASSRPTLVIEYYVP